MVDQRDVTGIAGELLLGLAQGLEKSAVDVFKAIYRLVGLRRVCETAMEEIDLLCVPTIPTFVTRAQDAAEPVLRNSRLGTCTNFVNLLDLCGMAVPTGLRSDGRPASITLLGRAGADALVAAAAQGIEAGPMGATGWDRPRAQEVKATGCSGGRVTLAPAALCPRDDHMVGAGASRLRHPGAG